MVANLELLRADGAASAASLLLQYEIELRAIKFRLL
jgi:hypothetical protein